MERKDYEHVDNIRGDAGVRFYDNGKQKYKLVCDRQTGLWGIKTEQGPLPKILEGGFTAPQYAVVAIKHYHNSKKV